ncbi:hypothetical protein CCP3SC1_20093 [Gammaproteobacteria bacterium]
MRLRCPAELGRGFPIRSIILNRWKYPVNNACEIDAAKVFYGIDDFNRIFIAA